MAMRTPKIVSRTLVVASLAAMLGAAGCLMQANYDARVTTADGEVIDVPLAMSKLDITDGVVAVNRFQFIPTTMADGQKGLQVSTEAVFSGGALPTSIVVKDVTEAPIMPIIDDRDPKMVKGTHWIGTTPVYRPSDDNIYKWMLNLDNSIRIYRFTIKLADQSTHVLNVPMMLTGDMKSAMMSQYGFK
jgi:hypothetical protein